MFQEATLSHDTAGSGKSLLETPAAALAVYGLADAEVVALSSRLHALFRVDAAGGRRYVLRIYQPGIYTAAEIRSELAWLTALRRDEGLLVPEPVAAPDSSWVQRIEPAGSAPRHLALFRWTPGRVPDSVPDAATYRRFGEFMARLHRHGGRFQPPADFDRPRYDLDRLLGPPGAALPAATDSTLVSAADRQMLNETAALLRPEIEELGEGGEVFGLIHGDLQVSNQVLHEGEVGALDFADCGWGYYLYDIAGALLPAWEGPGSEERREAFLRGYRRVRPLSREQEALFETFAVARGLAVMRWSLQNWDQPAVRAYGETIVPHLLGQIRLFMARRTGSAPPAGEPARELLARLRGLGIRLWEEDGRLRFKAAKGALTPDLRGQLADRKAEILDLLCSMTAGPAAPLIVPVPRGETMPTSFAQQRMWILDQIDPGSPAYHIAQAVRLSGVLRAGVLRRSLHEILRRHEVLRTTFRVEGGRPVQVIAPSPDLRMPIVDLRALEIRKREEIARRLAGQEAHRPFDLERGPLARFSLLHLAAGEHWLLLTFHHIISDGWSNGVLIRELVALYRAHAAGRRSPLRELPIQYADFAHWQRRWLEGAVLDAQLAYWKRQLAGIPSQLELPVDRPRPRLQSDRGVELPLTFSPSLHEVLEGFSQRREVTLFMTLLAALVVLLHRHTGQHDIVVGSPIANRNRSEIEGLIGFFVNTLVLRTRIGRGVTFEQLLTTVRATTLEAYAHQDLPFEMLVDALEVERNPSYTPVFQVLFVLQNAPSPAIELPGLTLSYVDPPRTAAAFDLSLTVRQRPDGAQGALTYNADLLDDTRIRRMLMHFQRLLGAAVAKPEARVSELPLMSEAERFQLLREWNDRTDPAPHRNGIHRIFETQVARTPADEAVIDGEQRWTYAELNVHANQLAHYLLKQGLGPEDMVAVCLGRSARLIVAVLGVLKAGGAYVTLDPMYPSQRLAFMMEDTKSPILVTESRLLDTLPSGDARILCLDADSGAIARENTDNPRLSVARQQLAYAVYTSGSVGKPKGVMVSHGSLVGTYLAWEEDYHLRSWRGCHLQMASPSFDVFAGDWTRALCSGGKLVLCPWETLLEPEMLHGLMVRERVDSAEFVPAVLRGLISYLEETGQSLDFMRLFAVGSDTWYGSELQHVRGFCGPQTRLVNSYGVAEVTIDSTYFEGGAGTVSPEKTVPIGRPFGGNQIYLLDADLEPVPGGVPAELYLGGSTLARGYLARPRMTASRFIPNIFGREPGSRLYRTGDLARYLPEGNVDFLGRIDHQVKIRGFRIELGEVEVELGSHPAVREAAVVAREDRPGDRRLVGYVVPEPGNETTAEELRSFLKDRLPGYMVPTPVLLLDSMPLTPNGKVDHRALPAPDAAQLSTEESYVAPESPTEETLAGIWSELLGVERVGTLDNFFDLGGNSLSATQLISRVRTVCQVELSLATFFEGPTVADLARSVEVARRIIADAARTRDSTAENREEGEL